jgi:Putative transposase
MLAEAEDSGAHVAADNRDGLEQLARYVLRSPIAQERLTRTADGRVLLTLKAERSDGTTHLLFEPIELLERLAALTPRPRINLVLHHGVLAPHSRWRAPGGCLRAGHARPARPRATGRYRLRHGAPMS